MAEAAVKCPHCQSEGVVKYGKTRNGKERFRCQHSAHCGRTFLRSYAYPGCLPPVKQQIVEMTRKGRGIRDIVRVLQGGPTTGLKQLKKSVRPLPGQHQRSGGVLSRRDHGRSAPRGSGGSRGNVEFRAEQSPPTLGVACD